jgi:hypothetical protein
MEKYLTTYSIHTGFHQYDDDWQLHDTEEAALEWIARQQAAHGHRLVTWFVARIVASDQTPAKGGR